MNLPPHHVADVHPSAISCQTMLDRGRGKTHHQRVRRWREIWSSFPSVDLGLLLAQFVAAGAGALAAGRGIAHGVIASGVRVRVQSLQGYRQLLLEALLLYSCVRLAARQDVPILLILRATGLQTRLLRLLLRLQRLLLTLVLPVLLVFLFMLHFMLATVIRQCIIRGIVPETHGKYTKDVRDGTLISCHFPQHLLPYLSKLLTVGTHCTETWPAKHRQASFSWLPSWPF